MGKIAFLFAGQGAQYVGMGKDLYETSNIVKDTFDMGEVFRKGTIAQCFGSDFGVDDIDNIDTTHDKEVLSQTKNTQPCLFLTDLACAKVLRDKGIEPDMVAGFSLGEIAALAFSNVLSEEDAFKLVTLRGVAMEKCANENPGGMVAVVRLDNDTVDNAAKTYYQVDPVDYNCPGQVSVAGKSEEVEEYAKDIKELGGRAIKLAVSGPFHTPFMREASNVLQSELEKMEVNTPSITLYSNMTGKVYPQEISDIIQTVALQASNSVKWETIIRKMYDDGCDTFIEVGPGKILAGFIAKTLMDVKVYNVSDVESLNSTLQELDK